jgi:ribosomal protein S18 acetylase RimI-like enzyme
MYSIIPATMNHFDGILRVCSENFVLNQTVESAKKNGATYAIYSAPLLTALLKDNRSLVVVDNEKNVHGYLLLCSKEGYEPAFGKNLDDFLKAYDVPVPEKKLAYLSQVCVGEKARGRGFYRQMTEMGMARFKSENVGSVFTKIYEQNVHSRKVHAALGWEETNGTGIQEFKKDDGSSLSLMWRIYRKEL